MPDTQPPTTARWFTMPRIFVAMSVAFGLAMLLLTPPFEVPDEPHHFMRAYQISEGHLLPTFRNNTGGADLPRSIALAAQPFDVSRRQRNLITFHEIVEASHIPLDPDDRVYFEFSNTSAYPPLPYIPQALAIMIGRTLSLTPIQLMYFARLFNLLVWVLAGYLALSFAPGIRRPLFLLMLMPMSLYLAASMSADVVGNALAILFCAMVWRQLTEPADKIISSHRAWLFIAMAFAIGLTKFVYLPLVALPFLIPAHSFGGGARKSLVTTTIIAVGLFAAVAWSKQTPGLDMIANGESRNIYPRLQIEFLHQHPSAWLTVPIQTLKIAWRQQLISFVGEFGWMDVPMSPIICILYFLALLWACQPLTEERPMAPIWKWAALIPAIIIVSLFALGLTAYLYWNPLGSPDVKGLQGRYLIPLAPAAIMLISRMLRGFSSERPSLHSIAILEFATALIPVFTLAYGLYVIYTRFYTNRPWL